MKHKEYRQKYLDLRADVVSDINHSLIKANANEIELNHGILHLFVDDQQNEVIKRVRVESSEVKIDTGDDDYELSFDDLSLDELLSILELVEAGKYEVWEEFEN